MHRNTSWIRLKALIWKELLAVLYDKRSRIALIAPPLIQLFLFANAATLEVYNIKLGIYNADSGAYSAEVIERLQGSPFFTEIHYAKSNDELRMLIDTQKVLVGVELQSDFSKHVSKGDAQLLVILDGRKSNASQIVSGYVTRIIGQMNVDLATNGIQMQTTPAPMGGTAYTVFRAWFNPALEYIYYNVPSLMATLGMILGLTVTALSVAREREMGTFDQLLVSPLQPWEILVGKSVPALIVALSEVTMIFIISLIVFKVPFLGSIVLFYCSMIVFLIAIIGVGLFISSISKTQQQANLGNFVFMMPTMLLSGYASPVENIVPWLQPVSQCNPLTHFLIIVKGVFLKDMPMASVLNHIWPMALCAIVTLSVAGWMFKRRME